MNRPNVRVDSDGLGRTGRTPEFVLALGPTGGEGVIGDETFAAKFGGIWGLSLELSGPTLYQLQGAAWKTVSPLSAFPFLLDTARHVTFCFDQNARLVLAWELEGQMYVWQYDALSATYIVRGPFIGHDPVLLMDATVTLQIPGSDVILFHTTTDRRGISWRYQSENFATAHQLLDNTGVAVSFAQDIVLDQIAVLPYRYQIAYRQADGTKGYLYSQLYAVSPIESVIAHGAPLDGTYLVGVIRYTKTEPALQAQGAPLDGTYLVGVIRYTKTEPALQATASPLDGGYYV